jgi:hypothetical protein
VHVLTELLDCMADVNLDAVLNAQERCPEWVSRRASDAVRREYEALVTPSNFHYTTLVLDALQQRFIDLPSDLTPSSIASSAALSTLGPLFSLYTAYMSRLSTRVSLESLRPLLEVLLLRTSSFLVMTFVRY